MSDLPPRISLREVGPRDGLQNEAPVSTAAKVELVDALSRDGRRAHRDGVFRSPARRFRRWPTPTRCGRRSRGRRRAYSALVPNLRGAERALDAGFREIEVVVSCIRHAQPQERQPLDRGVARRHRRLIALAHAAEGRLPGDRVDGVGLPVRGRRAGRAGSSRWRAGRWPTAPTDFRSATPPAWRRRRGSPSSSGRCGWRLPESPMNLHFHNTRGTGAGQRAGGARTRRRRLRRVRRRPRRLPLRARRDRQRRHRGAGAHGRGHGRRDRRRPRGDDRCRRAGRAHRRPRRCPRRCCGQARARAARPTRRASFPLLRVLGSTNRPDERTLLLDMSDGCCLALVAP